MNWARASWGESNRPANTAATRATGLGFIFRRPLSQQDTRAADPLRRDHPEEVRQQPVHQLEIRRERRDLLLLAVQHFFGELLLVQQLARAAVDEVEVGGQAEALAFEIAVAPQQPRAVGAGVAHHPLLGLEARAVLDLEAHAAGD